MCGHKRRSRPFWCNTFIRRWRQVVWQPTTQRSTDENQIGFIFERTWKLGVKYLSEYFPLCNDVLLTARDIRHQWPVNCTAVSWRHCHLHVLARSAFGWGLSSWLRNHLQARMIIQRLHGMYWVQCISVAFFRWQDSLAYCVSCQYELCVWNSKGYSLELLPSTIRTTWREKTRVQL